MEILMIDDTRAVQAFVKNLLAKAPGINVTAVMNGQEGWELLRSGRHFDLILLDWEMPVLNGPDTIVKIRESGITTPILMMTTKNEPEDIQRVLELGAAEYLMKPFTADILFEKIGAVLGQEVPYAA